MSTYKTRLIKKETTEQKKVVTNRDKAIKALREWMNTQNWVKSEILSWETVVRGMNSNEIMILIHCTSNVETVLTKLKSTNFQKEGLNIKFNSTEQASWNCSTYFIDFEFLG